MSGIGATGGGQVGKAAEAIKNAAKEAAKNVGTGPSPIEKKIDEAVVKAVKGTVDSVSKFVTSPEGSAITAGVLMKVAAPFSPIGDAFILGGAAYGALRYIESHDNLGVTLAKDALIGTAGVMITPAMPALGVGMAAAAVVDAAVSVAEAANKSVAETAKGIARGAAEGATKAIENSKKPKVQ